MISTRSEAIERLEKLLDAELLNAEDTEAVKVAIRDIKSLRHSTTITGFECDPNKAKDCKKTNCYIYGGECYVTRNQEWEYN